jgi:hypothetical protein
LTPLNFTIILDMSLNYNVCMIIFAKLSWFEPNDICVISHLWPHWRLNVWTNDLFILSLFYILSIIQNQRFRYWWNFLVVFFFLNKLAGRAMIKNTAQIWSFQLSIVYNSYFWHKEIFSELKILSSFIRRDKKYWALGWKVKTL